MQKPRKKKPKKLPLTRRVWQSMKKHGRGTADAIARRVGAKARAVSKALFSLKLRDLSSWRMSRDGEPVWQAKGKLH